jgi:hypothetical protein
MIRTLRILMLAGMALAAVSAFGSTGAQAAEFHCSVEPCTFTLKPDGTVPSKTAHHVFIVNTKAGGVLESVSSTCNELSGHGTSSTKTTTDVTATSLIYTGCTFNGQASTVTMNGCKYTFKSAGTVSIVGCESGKKIEITIAGCVAKIGEQEPTSTVTYHDAGTTKEQMTVSAVVTKIKGELVGTKANCGATPGAFEEGEYTTGNTIVTGEEDKTGGAMAGVWWE